MWKRGETCRRPVVGRWLLSGNVFGNFPFAHHVPNRSSSRGHEMQKQTAGNPGIMLVSSGSDATEPLVIVACCLAIIAALVLGVGLGSHLVLRHIVQTAPLWIAVILGFRRSQAAGWVGLPLFLFWLALMLMIWLYLLGISHLLSGNFSALEIAMTIVVGTGSLVGIWASARLRSSLSVLSRVAMFVILAIVQVVCFRLSFLPAIAHR